MKIYMASKVKHAPKWLELRDRGAPIISTWIDEWQPNASKDHQDLWRRCVDEAHRADVLIAYREEGEIFKGAPVEIGAALAGGAGVILGRALFAQQGRSMDCARQMDALTPT